MFNNNGKKIVIWFYIIFIFVTACNNGKVDIGQNQNINSASPTSESHELSSSDLSTTPIQLLEKTPAPSVFSTSESLDSSLFYFTVRDDVDRVVEIWQTSVDARNQWQLHTVPIKYPISTLPAQELAILSHDYCVNPQNSCPDKLIYGLGNLMLSPNKKMLTWIDGASWCPNTSCYGFEKMMVWDLLKGDVEILLEIPFHIDLETTQTIIASAWAPDSKQIAFVLRSHERGWSLVRVVDIETKQIQDITEGLAPIAWSPDGERMAVTIRGSTGQNWSWGVKIVGIDGEILATFMLNGERVTSIDWSPDGSKLALTVLVSQQVNDENTVKSDLLIIDLTTAEIERINLFSDEISNYSEPHWSPNGDLLGVNVTRTGSDKELIILDTKDWSINSSFSPNLAFDKWSWSNAGDAILVLVGGDLVNITPFPPAQIGIFYLQDNHFEILSLPSQLEERIEDWTAFVGNLTW